MSKPRKYAVEMPDVGEIQSGFSAIVHRVCAEDAVKTMRDKYEDLLTKTVESAMCSTCLGNPLTQDRCTCNDIIRDKMQAEIERLMADDEALLKELAEIGVVFNEGEPYNKLADELTRRITILADEIDRLKGERDRQYEYNAGQIATIKQLHDEVDRLKVNAVKGKDAY